MLHLTDAHCHLEEQTYGSELPLILERATQAGVTHLLAVGASRVVQGAHEVLQLAEKHALIQAAIGIHPHDAALTKPADLAWLDEALLHPKARVLGEIGLDFYYNNAPAQVQIEVFEACLGLAKKHQKPVMLHIREATSEALSILDKHHIQGEGCAVIHCFTGSWDEAQLYLNRGFYLSIPGVVTFKNAADLRTAVQNIPAERLLLETDCPYLTPVPLRGKRNEPSYLVHTAQVVADLKGLSLETLAQITTHNARQLCRLS